MKNLLSAILISTAFAPTSIAAHEYKKADLSISHPWTRQTAPAQKTGGGFMVITNKGANADRLLSVSSTAAGKVEIHTMEMTGGVMKMRPVSGGLSIPAKGRLELKPGGHHIMFIGLKAPFKLGEMIPLTLHFEQAGAVPVQVKVEPINHGTGGGHDHH